MAGLDLAIRGARILDGSGGDALEVDVGIRGAVIEVLGALPAGGAAREIDASGLVLAPGFVDAHTHDDGALLAHPGLEFKLSQGVTSVVVGNCGFSAAPRLEGAGRPPALALSFGRRASQRDLAGYLAAVDAARPACNAVALVGHNTLRAQVVPGAGPATAPQLAQMRSEVERALEQGACGFSTGLVYTPGRHAATEEVIELARPLRSHAALYATHMRNEGDRLLESIEETLRIGREAGCAVHVSHHKSAGPRNFGRVRDSLARIDRANAGGMDVTLDFYPYTASSGPMAEYFRLERLDLELAAVTHLASCPDFPAWEGRGLAELAVELGVPLEELTRRVLSAPRARETICIQFSMDEADVETNLRHPLAMIGSDGIPELRGRPHPRLFGTCPRVLARYVRERGVLSLAEAVRRMTSLPCGRFGLAGRGRVAEGAFADLVVFDPARVEDTASYAEPKREALGIEWVIVNGRIALERGRHTGAGAGRALRYRALPEERAA